MENHKKILKKYWGFQSFKPAQEAVLQSLENKKMY